MTEVSILLVDARPGPEDDVAAALAGLDVVVEVLPLDRLGPVDHAVAVAGGDDLVEELLEDLTMMSGIARVERAPPDDPAREKVRRELGGD